MIAPTLRSELIVRMEGLEPPRREAPDPKSGAATNYATCAISIMKTKNIPIDSEQTIIRVPSNRRAKITIFLAIKA